MTSPCLRCGEDHGDGEPGFSWPDAVFALSLPEEERRRLQDGQNEDVAQVRGSCFVRGVAFFPIRGTQDAMGVGFWIRISAADFADFEAKGRVDHPAYNGRIANQDNFLGPTLGLAARLEFRGAGSRPAITLTDPHDALAFAQQSGVLPETIRAWAAIVNHAGEPEPLGQPFTARLPSHGWEIADPYVAGRVPATPSRPPEAGDKAKVIVVCEVSDEKGDVMKISAGWWVELDEFSRPDLWGATLANRPRVPAPLSLGSRMWVNPAHIIEYEA